jgi:hypothetical protein
MKSGKLFIFLAMLALALCVLTATAYAAPTGPDYDMRPVVPDNPPWPATSDAAPTQPAAGGIESLSGSFVVFDPSAGGDTCFTPGQTQTFCFRAESFTTDYEYILNLWERFPPDWTVSDVYVQGTPSCDSGVGYFGTFGWSFQTPSYEVNISHPRYQQSTDHCTAYYCFEVVSGTGTPDALESWYWVGDGWGGTPHWPCSSDNYTPVGQMPCDEAVQPQATIPPCQPYEWLKFVNGARWTPGFSITVQTSDTIQVTEIVTTGLPFTLIENWNPEHLSLLDWQVSPGGIVIPGPGHLEWFQPPGGLGPWYIVKRFHVEQCTWLNTMLDELLMVDPLPPEPRPVLINKLPPELWIDAVGGGPAWAGQPANFTLIYSNTGGYENNVVIYNNFPPGAPFLSSVPPPDIISPDYLFAQWFVGDLPQGAQRNIDVTVMISPTLPPSTTLEIWDYIFDHTNQLRGSVMIPFHVEPWLTWEKYVDAIAWQPGMDITRQTSDTIVVQEVLHLSPPPPVRTAVAPVLTPSALPPEHPGDVTTRISGRYTPVAPRSPEAILWDQSSAQSSAGTSDYFTNLSLGAFSADDFQNAELWAIDTIFVDGWDIGGDLTRASLLTWYIYPDAGGVPAGYPGDGSGTELWSLSLLPGDPAVTLGIGIFDPITLDVSLAIGGPLYLPPGHYWLVFYPSLDNTPGWWFWRFATTSNLHHPQVIDPTNYFGSGWTSWTDWTIAGGSSSYTDMVFRLEGTTVPPPVYAQVETWDPTRLHLLDWAATGGNVIVDPTGQLAWTGDILAPETITLTKWFHVEPCTWTVTTLWEELWLDQVELEQRPVVINKLPPALWIDATYQPGVLSGFPANFTLNYGNTGGFENAAGIYNTFPPEAPFVSSVPPPDIVDPSGLFAQWNLGSLPQDAQGNIDVTVMIQPGLPPSTTIEIWDYIFDHTLEVRDGVSITFHVNPAYEWSKLINGLPWDPAIVVTVQTSDTIVIEETITSPLDYTLVENWDIGHLRLLDYAISGGVVITIPGQLDWHVPPGMPPQTITKWFHVEPCTWTDTLLQEMLVVDGLPPELRPVMIHKLPSALWIDAQSGGSVLPGQPANFTLLFGNTGGFENDVMIHNDFPPTAPFLASSPPPNRQDPGGLWAEWDFAGLPMGAVGNIDVTVQIQPTVPPSTTIEIWDGIYDHTGTLVDWVVIPFHVEPAFDWIKLVNGVPWDPAMVVTVQTSDTLVITDTVASPLDRHLVENWNPAHLQLINWAYDCGTIIVEPGHLEWFVIPGQPPCTLTKWFHVEPCTWTDTLLEEILQVDNLPPELRLVHIHKLPADLWIDAQGGGPALPGQPANFTLLFGNTGGFENNVTIRNNFPPEAPFVAATPPPDRQDPNGLWAEWDIAGLPQGAQGNIDITVMIQPTVPPSTTVEIWDGIFDHTDALVDWVIITFHVEQPPLTVLWDKYVDGMPWTPGMEITRQTSDTIEVVEVIHIVPPPLKTAAQGPIFDQIETWDPTRLHLVDWAATGGVVVVEPNRVTWTGELIEPTTITLTKWFHVEPCTWTVTTLWEELWLDQVELEQRPVVVHKLPPALWIDAVGGGNVFPGQPAGFSLLFGNNGGFENDVLIRNEFPPEAPFVSSVPPPTSVDPAGLWAEWGFAGLAQGQQGAIDVTVMIQPTVPPSTTVTIVDFISDHVRQEWDWVTITFHTVTPYRYIYIPVVYKHYVSGR